MTSQAVFKDLEDGILDSYVSSLRPVSKFTHCYVIALYDFHGFEWVVEGTMRIRYLGSYKRSKEIHE